MSSVLAAGAFLKNAACLLVDGRATPSAAHGDLATPEACLALEASLDALLARAGGRVDAVAHDLHPDFHSTRVAQALAARLGVPAIGVQHHVAHIGVVAAEQRLHGPVLGIALDGFGLGDDGGAWGGELLWIDGAQWRRLGALAPIALPGGDRAAREPWRLAAAALHALGRGAEIEPRLAPAVGETAARAVHGLLKRGFQCPPTSSAGRWFDAAAGALGLSVRQSHEAEAAVALERLAGQADDEPVAPAPWRGGRLDLLPLLDALFTPEAAAAPARAARRFHLALADGLAEAAHALARETGTATVVLAGGCFYNRLLSARLAAGLVARGLRVLRPRGDCGDGGLALGQAWITARRLEAGAPAMTTTEETRACA